MVDIVNHISAIGILILGILSVVYLIIFLKNKNLFRKIEKYSNFFLPIILIGSLLGSMAYQYIFGYEPCSLCWYQRIFIFSLAILSLTADIRKSILLRKQFIILSGIGLLIALFHIIVDRIPSVGEVCGTGTSCLVRYVNVFDFVTIQFMSAVVLASVLIVAITSKK